mmetsp:Transcript_67540/g.197627  ORF Transcript_67540/g.197627 Transcript_67540/m.197627 type:complete len:210 (+) Transcript_67540:363-992(+)
MGAAAVDHEVLEERPSLQPVAHHVVICPLSGIPAHGDLARVGLDPNGLHFLDLPRQSTRADAEEAEPANGEARTAGDAGANQAEVAHRHGRGELHEVVRSVARARAPVQLGQRRPARAVQGPLGVEAVGVVQALLNGGPLIGKVDLSGVDAHRSAQVHCQPLPCVVRGRAPPGLDVLVNCVEGWVVRLRRAGRGPLSERQELPLRPCLV